MTAFCLLLLSMDNPWRNACTCNRCSITSQPSTSCIDSATTHEEACVQLRSRSPFLFTRLAVHPYKEQEKRALSVNNPKSLLAVGLVAVEYSSCRLTPCRFIGYLAPVTKRELLYRGVPVVVLSTYSDLSVGADRLDMHRYTPASFILLLV